MERRISSMKGGRWWKVVLVVAIVLVVGGAGGYAWILHTRPAALGLAGQIHRTPAPSPSPDDPAAQLCKLPAKPATNSSALAPGLWIVQPGSVAGYRAREQFEEL